MLTVSQVAKLAGVSVRALHHYDELGLLRPSGRSEAGYRLYAQADLERLQQILFFRELQFPLEEIARLLSQPDFDRRAALLLQRQLLVERAGRLQGLIASVDTALAALERGRPLSEEVLFEAFGGEARERWGDTEAYRSSAQRTARYTADDWKRYHAEAQALTRALVAAMERGVPPQAEEAIALAEQHRGQISRWFYECSPRLHRGLADLYAADPRFSEHFDRERAGLAAYLREVIYAAAARSAASDEGEGGLNP